MSEIGKKDVKYLTIKEFQELGLLREVNRLFFHPRGLALEITVPEDKDGEFDPDATGTVMKIWDERDDLEGIYFGNPPTPEKAKVAQDLYDQKAPYRQEHLGWVIQPITESEV